METRILQHMPSYNNNIRITVYINIIMFLYLFVRHATEETRITVLADVIYTFVL